MANVQALTFRGALIRYIDVRRKKEGPPFVRVHFCADLSAPIRSAMGWSVGEGQKSGSFSGLVVAQTLILTPNNRKLPGMGDVGELQIECTEVSDFAFVEKRDKDGALKGTSLNFVARSADDDAAAKLDAYWRGVLGGDSQLKVTYSAIGTRSEEGEDAEEGED